MKRPITLFWFKRDLRLHDNPALQAALSKKEPLLLFYCYEPSIWSDPHFDERHLNFIKESLTDLNEQLKESHTKVLCVVLEIIPFFEIIQQHYAIQHLVSAEESGIDVTYDRDKKVKAYCKSEGIDWYETQTNGVIRGLRNRKGWSSKWYRYMTNNQLEFNSSEGHMMTIADIENLEPKFELLPLETSSHPFQKGGRSEAIRWKESFFQERVAFYSDYISKPELSRYGCSRLSPYISWGNLSIRELYQEAKTLKSEGQYKKQLNAFMSRLRWQSHFIQKFEMEPRMQFEAVNRGFLELEQPINEEYIKAWKTGQTGYPLVDACIRCLIETGYVNFRMRAMITSFFCHHLFQHFKHMSEWLARQFLDFEAGIHYGQLQMQAGFTGTNTIRVYSPTKNALDHDPDAIFIKKYLPELSNLPANLAIQPWEISSMESEMFQFTYGVDYPERIVDINETRAYALSKLYAGRRTELALSEKERIVATHTIQRN